MKTKLLPFNYMVIFYFIAFASHGQTNKISFSVDASVVQSTFDEPITIGISGNIEPLTWQSITQLSDADDDGIFQGEVEFESGSDLDTLEFKFRLNGFEWEVGDNRKVHLASSENVSATFRYQALPENPFARFIGSWTLKNDDWKSGNQAEENVVKWYNHFSSCKQLHTVGSLLWTVDAGSLRGNILWVYNFQTKEMVQSSSYTPTVTSLGKGKVDKEGNIELKVHFDGNMDAYRLYTYTWLSDDEYQLHARYFENDQPTGFFYQGNFVRADQ